MPSCGSKNRASRGAQCTGERGVRGCSLGERGVRGRSISDVGTCIHVADAL